uniref:Phosphoinositide interacting regulator of transient receptor potential channels n=1 Tax=Pundamilia nyererei TaxID=303518 RepID=A0A3B4EZ48_9CICH
IVSCMEENAPLGIKRHNFCAVKWALISVRVGQCEENLIFRLFRPGRAYLHKPIIVIVMGSLMSVAGAVLLLLQYSGVTEASRSVASACLSLGLMFVAMGLVWVPILKEKERRKRISQGYKTKKMFFFF